MTVRCLLRTSSYLRTFFRITKFCSSTFFCAFSICRERMDASIGWFSSILKRSLIFLVRSPAKSRAGSSSPARSERQAPGAPLLVADDETQADRLELPGPRLEDEVVVVLACHRDVGRNLDDVEVVDLDELLLLRLGRTGHSGQLLVHAEVVLERDRREGDVLLLDADVLLRLDRLVQALRPAPPLHDPAGELVDDLDLTVL